jgi:hypothetical protein
MSALRYSRGVDIVTKRLSATPQGVNPFKAHRDNRPKLAPKLVAWTRHDTKGLYELFKSALGGFFVRRSSYNGKIESWRIEAKEAVAILTADARKRSNLLKNPLLRRGYVEVEKGITYDTPLDEILYVGDGDETEAAAVFRTRGGHEYIYLVEYNDDTIWPLEGLFTTDDAIPMINFWFNMNPSFRWFVNIVKFGDPIEI